MLRAEIRQRQPAGNNQGFTNGLFGGRGVQRPKESKLMRLRKIRRGVNFKYLLRLRGETKSKNGGEDQQPRRPGQGEVPKMSLNHLNPQSIQLVLMRDRNQGMHDIFAGRRIKLRPSHHYFENYYAFQNRLDVLFPLHPEGNQEGAAPQEKKDSTTPPADSNSSDGPGQPDEFETFSELVPVFETRFQGNQELMDRALKEEFIFNPEKDQIKQLELQPYLEHTHKVIARLRTPLLGQTREDELKNDHDEEGQLILTLVDLELLFRNLWNKPEKTRVECLNLLAYSLHLINLNQFWGSLTSFMSNNLENRGLKDLLGILFKPEEPIIIKEALISLIYDLQQREENPSPFNFFLLQRIGKTLVSILDSQEGMSEDGFVQLIELLEDIIISQMVKPAPEELDKDEAPGGWVFNKDPDYIDFVSETAFRILCCSQDKTEIEKKSIEAMFQDVYFEVINDEGHEDQAQKEYSGGTQADQNEAKKELSTKNEVLEEKSQKTIESGAIDLEEIDSDWGHSESEGEEYWTRSSKPMKFPTQSTSSRDYFLQSSTS